MVDLGDLGGGESMVTAINGADQVVGHSLTAGGAQHAFLWEDGTTYDLGTLGGASSTAVAINDSGQILGESERLGGVTHAVIWMSHRALYLPQIRTKGPFGVRPHSLWSFSPPQSVLSLLRSEFGERSRLGTRWSNKRMHARSAPELRQVCRVTVHTNREGQRCVYDACRVPAVIVTRYGPVGCTYVVHVRQCSEVP